MKEVHITGWVAKDISGEVYLFTSKPQRNIFGFWYSDEGDYFEISPQLFPDLTNDSPPLEVEIKSK